MAELRPEDDVRERCAAAAGAAGCADGCWPAVSPTDASDTEVFGNAVYPGAEVAGARVLARKAG